MNWIFGISMIILTIYCIAIDYSVTEINCRLDTGKWHTNIIGGGCTKGPTK